MKNLKTLYLFVILITTSITISSCKKEKAPGNETNEEPAITTNEYFPVSVGSYWVYEFDMHPLNGSVNDYNSIDTLKVIGDTLIDDENYFIFKTDRPAANTIYYRRINQGEVIAPSGDLVCPPDNSYTGIYNDYHAVSGTDTAYYYWEDFTGYETINSSFGSAYSYIQKTVHREYSPSSGGLHTSDTMYYSPIGILQRSYSYFSGGKWVGTLVDYHLE